MIENYGFAFLPNKYNSLMICVKTTLNPKSKPVDPRECYIKSTDNDTLENEHFDVIAAQMKLKENKLSDELMSYLWDLLEVSYTGEDKSKLSITWPVSPSFELITLKAYW